MFKISVKSIFCKQLYGTIKIMNAQNKNVQDGVKAAVIDIPKTRTRTSSKVVIPENKISFKRPFKFKDYRFAQPTSYANLNMYNRHAKEHLTIKTVKNDQLLLPYKMYSKKANETLQKLRRGTSIYKMHEISVADLRNRMQVEKPVNDVVTVTDIDKQYFEFVETRSLRSQIPLFKTLKYHFNDILRVNYDIGCRRDCLLQIEVNYKKELQKYEESVERCATQVKNFEKFISQDYEKSMIILDQYESQKLELDRKNFELEQLANRQFQIMSRLINLDYFYSVQQKYGRFLFYLSPPTWRLKHREFARSVEIEAKGFDFTKSAAEDTFAVILEKLKRECDNSVPPPLYFNQPRDLMNVFENIEAQQLWNLIRCAQMAPTVPKLKGYIEVLKDSIHKESNQLVNHISEFKICLEYLEERASYLEAKFYKILNGLFYESIGTPEVLKFLLHLEFCYESAYVDKPINSDVYTVGKGIECFFINYLKRLTKMHNATVHKAITQAMEFEKRKFRKAEFARKELRSFDILVKRLLVSFQPNPKSKSICKVSTCNFPTHYKKAKPQYSKKTVPKLKASHSLTEAERDYLILFTDWSANQDPKDYLQSLSVTEEEIKRNLHK